MKVRRPILNFILMKVSLVQKVNSAVIIIISRMILTGKRAVFILAKMNE